MADHFQAVHSKLVYTAEKLHTYPPTKKYKSKIFVRVNYMYHVV